MKSSHTQAGPPRGGGGGGEAAICPGPQACFTVFVGRGVPKENSAQGTQKVRAALFTRLKITAKKIIKEHMSHDLGAVTIFRFLELGLGLGLGLD